MLNNTTKDKLIKEFAESEKDTGSCQVQIALLSERIKQISNHLKLFPKDKHSRFGLIKLVGKRRTFYGYLKKKDLGGYQNLIKKMKDSDYI